VFSERSATFLTDHAPERTIGMDNFVYYSPTRVVFGRDTIPELADLAPTDRKILLTYGRGAIKRNGVYDQVREALGDRDVIEMGGIESNPVYEMLMDGVERVKAEGVGFFLAVGGGSVIDGTKFMAAATLYDERKDPWEFLLYRDTIAVPAALPLGVVLTVPATGSESNPFAVVSRKSTQQKLAFKSEHVCPRFAILDPEATFSLPEKQVRNGVVDSFAHVVEQYITYPANAPLQDRQAEAIVLTLLEEGPKTLANPTDYDARANFMWCATQALNGLLNCGTPRDFASHLIGHELTALYGVAHAESLAIVLPNLWLHRRENKAAKLLQYARRVWGIENADEDAAIAAAVRKTKEFFHSLGMPTRLSDYGISAQEAASAVRERLTERGIVVGERKDVTPEVAAEVLLTCA